MSITRIDTPFRLDAPFTPTGDQPAAIAELTEGVFRGDQYQTLLGATGTGKTFSVSHVIQNAGKPTLVISHNKTLAAQLYAEFRSFFPNNAVEFFISYYDYYQPEAYIVSSDTYIEKDMAINEEIDRLRLRATSALVSGSSAGPRRSRAVAHGRRATYIHRLFYAGYPSREEQCWMN